MWNNRDKEFKFKTIIQLTTKLHTMYTMYIKCFNRYSQTEPSPRPSFVRCRLTSPAISLTEAVETSKLIEAAKGIQQDLKVYDPITFGFIH